MQSSDFEKNIIFIFPRVENVENPLSIRIWALPEELTQGISQNVGVENVENPLYFWIWALPEELAPVNCKNSSDFEKNIIFMFPRVENIKNPHHFRSRVFLEQLPQGISQNLDSSDFGNKLIFMLPMGKTLKIHIISGSQLSLRSYRKAYFKTLPWKTLKIQFIFGSELSPRNVSKCWVELNSARNHNLSQRARISKINSFS
ncbi:hypothetical protein E2320_000126, partial [Naja naja]